MFNGDRIKNLGIKVGRIRGIDVHVHWSFLLLSVLLLFCWRKVEDPLLNWLLFTTTLIISVFLHELGHCFAALRQGGEAERIVLWPLGGLAYATAPNQPGAQFFLAAMGPLVNACLAILAALPCLLRGWSLYPEPYDAAQGFPLIKMFFECMVLWNVFLLVLNVFPCFPLDGGRMMQAALWSQLESSGHATYVTLRVSSWTAVVSLVIALVLTIASFRDSEYVVHNPFLAQISWGLLCVALLHFYEVKAHQHRLAYGDEEDKIFGYDFSRGYTSLERTATHQGKRTSPLASLREKFRRHAQAGKLKKEETLKKRLDSLLEKIHREGKSSLSRSEERFLIKVSKLLRK